MKASAMKYGGVAERLAKPMSAAQALRLKSLSLEAYQPKQYVEDLSENEALRRIAALKAEIALADSF